MVSSPLSYPFTLHQNVAQNLSDMKHSTFETGAAQLRSVPEIAPKSPFLFVNRSLIRYDFRVGAKVCWEPKLSLLIEQPLLLVTRFGHTATPKSDGSIVLTGGFGLENGKHMRLNGVHLLHTVQGIVCFKNWQKKKRLVMDMP